MSSRRRVSFKGRLVWFLLILGVWCFARFAFTSPDTELMDELGHRFAGWGEDEHAQLLLPGGKPRTEKVPVEHRSLSCPPVGTLELDEAGCRDFFAALPLGPQDLAVLLNRLHQGGVETVGISSPLTWTDEAGDMTRQLLCRVLGNFSNPVLGLRGRTAAQPDFTPVTLRDNAVPEDQVTGDLTGLPAANRPLPNGLTDTPDSLDVPWAPDWLEDEPHTQKPSGLDKVSFPLLVRWNGQTIPTLPLRLALTRAGLTAADVHAEIGKSIRFGKRTLPLDEHGRTRLDAGLALPLRLDSLGGDKELRRQLGEKGSVIIEQPSGAAGDSARLTLLARTLSQLAGTETVRQTTEDRPVGGRVLTLNEAQESGGFLAWGVVALVALVILVPLLPALLRLLLLLALLALLFWWARDAVMAGQWVSLTAGLTAWGLLLLLALFLRPVDRGYFSKR